jgi:hypothetical protein
MRRTLATSVVLLLLALLLAGCGGDDGESSSTSDSSSRTEDSATTEEPADADDGDADDSAVTEEPFDPDTELPPIQVSSPASFANLYRSFVLAGTAQVFEGDLRWAIYDASRKPMAQGRMTATCGGPCRGDFRTRVSLRGVKVGSWELHVWAPPVADDDPEHMHDTMVPIVVTARPVADVPPPDAPPPGGVPET